MPISISSSIGDAQDFFTIKKNMYLTVFFSHVFFVFNSLVARTVVSSYDATLTGFGEEGQLGQPTNTSVGYLPGTMGDNLAPIDLGTGRTAVAVDGGGAHTCAGQPFLFFFSRRLLFLDSIELNGRFCVAPLRSLFLASTASS